MKPDPTLPMPHPHPLAPSVPDEIGSATLWRDLGQALVIAVLLVSALFLIAGFLILPAAPLA